MIPLYAPCNYHRAHERVVALCKSTGLRVVTVHKYLCDPASVDTATRQRIEAAARSIGVPVGAFALAGSFNFDALSQRGAMY